MQILIWWKFGLKYLKKMEQWKKFYFKFDTIVKNLIQLEIF